MDISDLTTDKKFIVNEGLLYINCILEIPVYHKSRVQILKN